VVACQLPSWLRIVSPLVSLLHLAPMVPPRWPGEPMHPCPRCGRVVGPMHLRVENLQHLGWSAYRVESYVNWCGHAQEVIPVAASRWAGYAGAGPPGGALAGCSIRAPHEHASHTWPSSSPPSRSPYRWCSRVKATRAASTPGMTRDPTTGSPEERRYIGWAVLSRVGSPISHRRFRPHTPCIETMQPVVVA
jgi:hypothetical protein